MKKIIIIGFLILNSLIGYSQLSVTIDSLRQKSDTIWLTDRQGSTAWMRTNGDSLYLGDVSGEIYLGYLTGGGLTHDTLNTRIVRFNTSTTPPAYQEGQVYYNNVLNRLVLQTPNGNIYLSDTARYALKSDSIFGGITVGSPVTTNRTTVDSAGLISYSNSSGSISSLSWGQGVYSNVQLQTSTTYNDPDDATTFEQNPYRITLYAYHKNPLFDNHSLNLDTISLSYRNARTLKTYFKADTNGRWFFPDNSFRDAGITWKPTYDFIEVYDQDSNRYVPSEVKEFSIDTLPRGNFDTLIVANRAFITLPHAALYRNTDLTITATQNIWYKITGFTTKDADDIVVSGDSIQLTSKGSYLIDYVISFSGNNGEVWETGVFKNAVLEQPSELRYTSTSDVGNMSTPVYIYSDGNDWISFKIRNTSDGDDPTIRRFSVIVTTQHLEL